MPVKPTSDMTHSASDDEKCPRDNGILNQQWNFKSTFVTDV